MTADVWEKAFEQVSAGVGICNEDGRLLAANDAFAELLGRPRVELVGRPFLTFVHPQERAASLSCYFAAVVAAAAESPRRAAHSELRCLTGQGAVVWLAVTWTITAPDADNRQYGIVHLSNVTGRRVAEAQLAQAQRRFELAFDCAPIGIAVVSPDGRFMQVNRALQGMLGYHEAELLQLGFADVSHPDDRAGSVAVFDQLLRGDLDVHEGVKRYLHRDGHTVYARRVAAVARPADGQLDYLLLQIEDISAERDATDRLHELQTHDQLTGLDTREVLARQIEMSRVPRSLVLTQIEDLPHLTSTLGRSDTDLLLTQVAKRLVSCCRSGEIVARVGDSEFAIAVHDPDGSTGPVLAARTIAALAHPIVTGHAATSITARVGVDTDLDGTRTLDALLQRAGLAAQTGTNASPRTWASFDSAMLTSSARRLALEADLRRALPSGQLTLAYQPIIDLADGAMRSVEALSRWHHEALGTIAPDEFVALAERSTLIDVLTNWALDTACTDLARWRTDYPAAAELAVAVNISALCFAALAFPTQVTDCLSRTGVPANQLVLEITETAAAHADAAFIDNADQLRNLGVGIALDDFGAGHSSLSRVARLPITELKLDRSLTDITSGDRAAAALVRATVGLATDLGLGLIAEGIETPAQLDMLRRCGCPRGQGYLLGKPQSSSHIEQLLAAHQIPR